MKEKQIKELLWKYTREDTEIGEERGKKKKKLLSIQNPISFGHTSYPGMDESPW